MVMCSSPAKLPSGPPMPKAKTMMPHVLDRRIGEHALDVAPAVQHEGGEDQRHAARASIISGPGAIAAGFAATSILNRSSA